MRKSKELREAGISLSEVDHIAIGRDPKAKLDKKLLFLVKNPGGGWNAVLDRIKNAKKGRIPGRGIY